MPEGREYSRLSGSTSLSFVRSTSRLKAQSVHELMITKTRLICYTSRAVSSYLVERKNLLGITVDKHIVIGDSSDLQLFDNESPTIFVFGQLNFEPVGKIDLKTNKPRVLKKSRPDITNNYKTKWQDIESNLIYTRLGDQVKLITKNTHFRGIQSVLITHTEEE